MVRTTEKKGLAMLSRCDGPACTRCGCCDSEIIKEPVALQTSKGDPWIVPGRAECGHCGLVFVWLHDEGKEEEKQAKWSPDMDSPVVKGAGIGATALRK